MKTLIEIFDRKYLDLYNRTVGGVKKIDERSLFLKPNKIFAVYSAGEFVLRSAGKVEQTFGAITTRLWDDPFEWTLPEELSTGKKILEYLNEVETTRRKAFAMFASDEDLLKKIPKPNSFELKQTILITLFELLIDTLAVAENLQGRAELARLMIRDRSGKNE